MGNIPQKGEFVKVIPIPEYPPCRRCPSCGRDIDDEETVYEICAEYWVCEECAKDFITTNLLVDEIADYMGINTKKSGDIVYE